MREIEGTCENCQQRPATMLWIGEGGKLAMSRSHMQTKLLQEARELLCE